MTAATRKLFADELRQRLDELLFASHSHRSSKTLADGLEKLARAQQERVLHWTGVAAQSHAELGYHIAALSPQALSLLDEAGYEAWVLAALDLCDREGSLAAMALLRDVESFSATREAAPATARLADLEQRLGRFLQGLSGRPLGLAAGAVAHTDTQTVFLPGELAALSTAEENRRLYKATAALLWAQTRYGTFGSAVVDVGALLARWPDRERALRWFAALEAARLEAILGAELPGLAAEIARLRGPWPPAMEEAARRLGRADAGVADTIAVLDELMAGDAEPPPLPHAGAVDLEAALATRAARMRRETEVVRQALAAMKGVGGRKASGASAPLAGTDASKLEVSAAGEMSELPPDAQAAAQSLMQDLGELPPEALVPAGYIEGPWHPDEDAAAEEEAAAARHAQPLRRYDEWDYRRRAYRRGWCHLFEVPLPPGDAGYVDTVRQRHAAAIQRIRRRFEWLRGEDRLLGRQLEGDDLDLDALVEAAGHRAAGVEPEARLYSRRLRNERSLAVMFMVDMSGSTKGWVNDAEREALVMLCEALETLGDAYAIYGFSGWTRSRCEVYPVKGFGEPYDAAVRGRIGAIRARDYTRMGVAIRHLSGLLAEQPARHKLLVTLSDGRPDDHGDEYRGHYGVEDTRRALQEAHERGVRSYCVTIDRHGADYLPRLYGPARYTVIDEAKKLPLKVADIYRRLTS
ncbi:MAG TPA: nitric oxide reductase activation protein [Candidatus Desulfobacillus sp.]|nr:nitric oxide reductase activation protein [Candidatus Desulfobacillus sp.]